MKKGAHLTVCILIAISIISISTMEVFSQDIGAVYWFKKGVNEKDNAKKIELYQKAIQENPQFVEAYYNLALTLLYQKEYEKAEEYFKNALSANPNAISSSLKSNILNRLGSMYRKMSRFAEAEEAFQAALNITTDNKFKALTLYELGQTKILQGKYEDAINYFRQGMQSSPEERESFEIGIQLAKNQQRMNGIYQQGLQLVQEQKLTEAQEKFNEILAVNPNHEEAKKQIENIDNALKQKKEKIDQQTQPLYKQAMASMTEGNWQDAIEKFERIKTIEPNYPEIDNLISRAKDQQYQQLLGEQKIENYYVQGVENFENGNFSIALFNFEKVAELDQKYKDIESRLEKTKREINRANDLANRDSKPEEFTFPDPIDNTQLRSSESTTSDLEMQKLFTEKSQQLNAAIDSQLIQGYYKDALDLMQSQDWQRAIILLEKVKLIKPDYKNTEFLFSQAKQNIEKENVAAANQADSPAKSTSPSTILFAFIAGIIGLPITFMLISPTIRARYYILLKKYDKAREIYERMLSKKPNDVKLYITLANFYVNQNQIDEVAIRVIERAIQYNNSLKIQLEPIVTRYYLHKSKSSDNPKNLIQGALEDELKRMGN